MVHGILLAGAVAGVLVMPSGCATPFDSRDESGDFSRSIRAAVDREITTLDASSTPLETVAKPSPLEETLRERRDELETISPATAENPIPFDLGPDLQGDTQKAVDVTLNTTVATAIRHNLSIDIAELQPAINAEDVIAAQSVFDFVLFADTSYRRTDEPTTVPIFAGTPLGAPINASDTFIFDTGVRKRFTSGGIVELSTDISRFDNRTPLLELAPDPSYNSAFRLGYTQPLLRGFGESVNTASIRISENAEDRSVQELTLELLSLAAETERAYWDLVLAWKDVEILQWLVDVGVEVRDVLDRRRDFDTKLAQYSDAVARVEQRKADVIRGRRRVRAASDRLKLLMNDPKLTVGSEAVLRPVDPFIDSPIDYNLSEALLTAMTNRPEVQISLLTLADAAIIQQVTDNARLPLLNLTAEVATLGLGGTGSDAYGNAFTDQFVDYVVGLSFEYPLGNRGAEADFRRSRLERTQTLVRYRQTVQDVAFDVKDALRDVVANFELIVATRSFRIAQAENLRALRVEEETLAGLTPEFLDLKLRRQESLALARRDEVAALASFDAALANLYRAMGTGLTMNGIGIEVPNYDDALLEMNPPQR